MGKCSIGHKYDVCSFILSILPNIELNKKINLLFVQKSSSRSKDSLNHSGHPIYYFFPKTVRGILVNSFCQTFQKNLADTRQVLHIFLSNSSHSSSLGLMSKLSGGHTSNFRVYFFDVDRLNNFCILLP